MLRKRREIAYLVFVAVMVLVMAVGGCGPATPAATPVSAEKPTETPPTTVPTEAPSRPGGVLTIGHHGDPTDLDPCNTTAAFQSVWGHITEQLIMFDPERRDYVPWLATEWEWLDDMTLRMKLREGVKFTNGEEFDAEAAKYSLDHVLACPHFAMLVADSHGGTEVVDKYTVDLHINNQPGKWMGILGRASFVLPPEYTQEVGPEPENFGQKPIGTGPYKLAEWVKDDHITLEANMDYWGGPPPMDKLIYKVIPEEVARMAALETGEVDLITDVSASSAKRIEANPDLLLVTQRGQRMFGAYFDMRIDHPVKEKLVRQALNYAVDKEGIVKLFGDLAEPMTPQFLPPDTPEYNTDLKAYPYDPEKAKQLLAEAGYPDGFEATLKYTINRYPLDKEMGEAVAGYLEAVGIKVEQVPLEYGEFSRQHRELDTMGPMHQWGLLILPDACNTLGLLRWLPDNPQAMVFRHFNEWPEVDELLVKGCDASDLDERKQIYKRVTEIMAEDPHILYLVIPSDAYGVSKKVVNFKPRSDQVLWLRDVYKTE